MSRLFSEKSGGIQYEAYEIQSQPNVPLRIYVMRKAGAGKPRRIFMRVADDLGTNAASAEISSSNPLISQTINAFGSREAASSLMREIREESTCHMVFLPRGRSGRPPGATAGRGRTQVRRRFMLLGQTLDGMRVWDICQAARAIRAINEFRDASLHLQSEGAMGVNALYASLFTASIEVLELRHIPASHMEGPDYLNVLKYLDIPQAAAMAAERCTLRLQPDDASHWKFLRAMKDSRAAKLKIEWLN